MTNAQKAQRLAHDLATTMAYRMGEAIAAELYCIYFDSALKSLNCTECDSDEVCVDCSR